MVFREFVAPISDIDELGSSALSVHDSANLSLDSNVVAVCIDGYVHNL